MDAGLSGVRPRPMPTRDGQPFWAGLREHVLRLPYCPGCAVFFHPSLPRCARCLGDEAVWRDCGGGGRVRSWAVVRHPFTSGLDVPYVVAGIELDDQRGLFVDSTLTGAEECGIVSGLPVTMDFVDDPRGFTVHTFRPVAVGAGPVSLTPVPGGHRVAL